jgi:hypothetical protein
MVDVILQALGQFKSINEKAQFAEGAKREGVKVGNSVERT